MSKMAHEYYLSAVEKFQKGDSEGGYADLDVALLLAPDDYDYLSEKADHKYYGGAYDEALKITLQLKDVLMRELIDVNGRLSICSTPWPP